MVRPPMNRPVSRRRSPKTEVKRPGLVVRQGQYRVADDVARRIRAGHPWVYRDALATRAVSEATGTVVELIAGNREFVARGYVDQEHPVTVRILSRDPAERVHPGAGAIAARVTRAIQLRWQVMVGDRPTALRLFSGESEGLPGATIDRYGEFVVIQWLSGGALAFRDEVLDSVAAAVRPRGIYEQRRLRPLGGTAPPEPATLARGDAAPVEVIVEEAGCRFAVDVSAPLGVGFFPDLRLGRDAVARRASGRRLLNLFSYTGAFSVRAARAGATAVVAVDTAAKAHARARRNYELSGLDPATMEQVTGDALKTVERFVERGQRFDLVVCDPPTFSHGSKPGVTFSVAPGGDLAALAGACLSVLEPGGFLAFSSNSTRLSSADLDRALAEGAAQRRVDARVIERHSLPADFPVAPGFPEGNYLKFLLAVRA
jgi:23S rRNA (cytosine1962-C5)-methyltransferase